MFNTSKYEGGFMSKKFLFGLISLLGITLSFFMGLYVGGAPVRQYVALTGGAPGVAAMDLKNLSDQLVDQKGNALDDSVIANRSRQDLMIHLHLAAQLYCYMPDQYQKVVRISVAKLQNTMVFTDNRTVRAISFLTSRANEKNNECLLHST
jgi:hypothetical protein